MFVKPNLVVCLVYCQHDSIKWIVTLKCVYFIISTFLLDIDECDRNMYTCPAYAGCVNNDGSYDCQCNEGFSGDGSTDCVGK